MNLISAVFLLVCCTVSVLTVPRQKVNLHAMDKLSLDNAWSQFKLSHKKSYRNSTNESKRKVQFQSALKKINDHNQKYNDGQATFTLGINQFADWTSDEFMSYVNSGLKYNAPPKDSSNVHRVNVSGRATLPSFVDWRAKLNIPIRDQASCGSCWAFSAVFEVESFNILNNGKSTDLSEQNLVDCVYTRDGCQGGWMGTAYNYIINNNGINTETAYGYTSGSTKTSGTCKYSSNPSSIGAQLTGYTSITSGSESAVVDALANVGPLAVAIYVTGAFQYYKSGVLVDTSCPTNKGSVNHAVNLVGYGTDSATGQDYYILRNSWGTGWGNGGYMLYARNKDNQCGVASYATYPIIKSATTTTTTSSPATTTITTTASSKPVTSTIPTTISTTITTTTTSNPPTTTFTTTTSSKPVTSTIPTTISTTITTTTSQTTPSKQNTSLQLCNNGTGFYAYSGCKTYYYCTRTLYNASCKAGYIFDYASQGCLPSTQISCKLVDYECQYGMNFYPYPGCSNIYYCSQSITNYTIPTGYLFNSQKLSFELETNFKCPI